MLKILLTILFLSTTYSEETKFLPHMAIHLNKGCPQNSSCTKHLGSLYEKWEEVIQSKSKSKVDRFIKNYGYPLKSWTKFKEEAEVITFDSRCKQHRKKENLIYEAISFKKEIQSFKKIIPNKAIVNYNGQYKTYIIPRNTIPYELTNNSVEMIQDEKGVFFNLSISKSDFNISYKLKGNHEIKSISCSKDLENYFKKTSEKDLYLDVFCKSIWNSSTQSFNEVIFGWSC